jgi:hypothetical protein
MGQQSTLESQAVTIEDDVPVSSKVLPRLVNQEPSIVEHLKATVEVDSETPKKQSQEVIEL